MFGHCPNSACMSEASTKSYAILHKSSGAMFITNKLTDVFTIKDDTSFTVHEHYNLPLSEHSHSTLTEWLEFILPN